MHYIVNINNDSVKISDTIKRKIYVRTLHFGDIDANSVKDLSIDISFCNFISEPYIFTTIKYPSNPKYFNCIVYNSSSTNVTIRACNNYTAPTSDFRVHILIIGAY